MSKKPSAETELKRVKRELNLCRSNYRTLHEEAQRNLGRALRAEAELKEWKERFDLLLRSKQENKP